jgi:hypothetical protein
MLDITLNTYIAGEQPCTNYYLHSNYVDLAAAMITSEAFSESI